MYTIHIGVRFDALYYVLRAVRGGVPELMYAPAGVEGDGWQTWGEALGSPDNPDPLTMHVTFDLPANYDVDRAKRIADDVVRCGGARLQPLAPVARFGDAAVVTSTVDWSAYVHGIPFPAVER